MATVLPFLPTLPSRAEAEETASPMVARRVMPLPGGRSIAYAETGTGPDLVLIHGTLMALEDMWLALAAPLSRRYRVIAVDRPGHGLSERARLVDASPWRQAELIGEAMRAIGVRRPILVGHSFGATVALCHGLGAPAETGGVVALAPLCFPEPRLEQVLFGARFAPWLGDLIAPWLAWSADPALLPLLWRAIFLPQAMPENFARSFPFALASGPGRLIAEGEDAMSVWQALTRASLSYLGCRVPVRMLGGTADIVVNNGLHGALAAALIPEARFRWLHGAGHMLHHFHQDAVAAEIDAIAGAGR